jgi:hypothetical protein
MPRDWYRDFPDDVVIAFTDRPGFVPEHPTLGIAPTVEMAKRFDSPFVASRFIATYAPFHPLLLIYRSVALAEQDQEEAAYLEEMRT